MGKTLWVIMLIGAHFLSRLLQSEAYAGGLMVLLGARQSKEGWRVSVRPVALHACVHKCVRECVFVCSHAFIRPSLCLCVCVCIFYQGLIQVPPDAGAICSPANQRPQQNASPSEPWFTGGLPVCQYYSAARCALLLYQWGTKRFSHI